MSITAVANAKVYVSTQSYPVGSGSTGLVLTDYTTGVTWTEIGNVSNIGEFGDSAEVIKFNTIEDGRVRKLKGVSDAGTLELECAHDSSDAGQDELRQASTEPTLRAFKVVLNDPLNATGTGTTYYFRGLVMGARTKLGSASDVVLTSFQTEINSEILEVAATAGA